MAERALLTFEMLGEFRHWLKGKGYEIQDRAFTWEVLRAVKRGERRDRWVVIFKKADAKRHLTVQDRDVALVREFIRERRETKMRNLEKLTEHLTEMLNYHDCNSCKRENCRIKPDPGEQTRTNCFWWREEE